MKEVEQDNKNGLSYSSYNPEGRRRTGGGKVLAPRSLRKRGYHYMTQTTPEDVAKYALGADIETDVKVLKNRISRTGGVKQTELINQLEILLSPANRFMEAAK